MIHEVAVQFRATELARRAERRAYLRKLIANEAVLAEEKLTSADLKAHEDALRHIRAQELAWEKDRRPGYWQRLWAALRGF